MKEQITIINKDVQAVLQPDKSWWRKIKSWFLKKRKVEKDKTPTSHYNVPKTYFNTQDDNLQRYLYDNPQSYKAREEEYAYVERINTYISNEEDLYLSFDIIDNEIIKRVALSKYLTYAQLASFLILQDKRVVMPDLRSRIEQLARNKVLSITSLETKKEKTKLRVVSLNHYGAKYVKRLGENLNKGLAYVSYSNMRIRQLKPYTATDIRRILMSNEILLLLLAKNSNIKNFEILQTTAVAVPDAKNEGIGLIVRTGLTVRTTDGIPLLFEVVRNESGSMIGLGEKLQRYYAMLDSCYSEMNFYHDDTNPLFIIVGEDAEHTLRIYQYLCYTGLYNAKCRLLFTDDNLFREQMLLYEFASDDKKKYYKIPVCDKPEKLILSQSA